jgi:predicted dehydrogenase
MKQRKRYAHVGTGGRGLGYVKTIVKDWSKDCELVALCDSNPGHLEYYNKQLVEEHGSQAVPTYSDRQFDKMILTHKPDVVLVTTRDCYHDKYIVRAMELGCDVVTEKPMTTDEKKCQRIMDAMKRTGRDLRVTFNYRYSPPRTQVKDLLMKGTIGKILSVEFQWLLNTSHGADYFRRWHRQKRNSGGLMVHKATHHFDLVNWWLSACPEEVHAKGSRQFYGPDSGMAERYGLEGHAQRCLDCKYRNKKCQYSFWRKRKPSQDDFYTPNEHHDGYHRDQCVFGDEIDIEDTMNVVVQYNTGAFMSYSLNAFSPWEGYHVAFNGTRGRLEHDCLESVYVSGDGSVPGETIPQGTKIRVYPHFRMPRDIKVKIGKGGHGGGDSPLNADIFSPNPKVDPYKRAAGFASGAMSILTGVAANRSMKTGKPVKISSLVKGLPQPDYPEMKEW